MRLASRFGYAANQIRRDRPLTHEELMHHVPGIFGEEKHTSRSQNYTYIPTITVLESLQRGRLSAILRLPDPCARPGPPGIHQTHAASAAGRRDKRRACP
ncbi:CP4-57 prophage protein [Escherichia coli]|uniref:CP4-57 prophage protein n=1 Tax=Escherichia coli TaxID=562 RepID=A0A377K471_ECOLX|nr:CP4-57 prophage protein [Escherichia coli]